jgi:benzil reductase ((S)-benzoin forming)
MERAFFVITGTSRGIGEALARRVAQEGHTVLGVSRAAPDPLPPGDYHHLPFDLTRTDRVGDIIGKAGGLFDAGRHDFLCLVHNASATEPVGPVEHCGGEAIDAHMRIGLLAPMLLTSLFVKRFAGEPVRKKLAFISSGVAFRPLPDESIYCTAKAGLHMFAQCVGLEQKDRPGGFEVVSIGPGMVDTDMQRTVRSKSSEEFAMADFFKQAHADGQLQDPAVVAGKILTLLERRTEQGQYVSVNDA